ncbi:hypothetical protein [Virgisporangium aurantiacum]|uniref:hypothetical protein n=1 Tax=Virgisporangium aurantiacum TaxID=175570 RepID=UPI0019509E84|nr:hypothetical protein [Virgisporangium aurantiacum]
MRWPLVAAVVTGWLWQGPWAVLVLAVFTVASLAAASAPMYEEASDNAVFVKRRAAIAPAANQGEDVAVRVTASESPNSADQQVAVRDLRGVRHLSEPTLGGVSVGMESVRPKRWEATVSAGGRTTTARLLAATDPASRLVPVGAVTGEGVWLPEQVATDIGVHAGDTVTYRVDTLGANPDGVAVPVAGVYATAGSRLPADPPGGIRSWAREQRDFPGDPQATTLKAHLLIGDIDTIERLAKASGDRILWWADAQLDPGTTLAQARTAAREVEEVRRRYLGRMIDVSPVTPRVASGIAQVVADAAGTAEAVQRRSRVAGWAALVIGLASVLAIGLLAVRRRRIELRHSVGSGLSPTSVGALWFVEHLVPAVPAAFAGWALARALVERFGPPGAVTVASLRPALIAAGIAALAGPVTVAGVAAVSAARRVRPAVPVAPRRPRPWGLLVVVAAAVAAVGMWGTTQARGIDLLVPLLVFAAAGVLGGTLVVRLASLRRTTTTADRRPAVVGWLLRRRLAAGGERVLTVVLLATGLGMLVFTMSAVDTIGANIDDRVATSAGAAAIATIPGSHVLDDQPVQQPPEPDPQEGRPPEGLVPGVRTPPLPPHLTLVWRIDAYTPYDEGIRDLVVIEPESFLRVADWGRGPDLAAARDAVRRLAGADPSTWKVPVIVVGDPSLARVDDVPVILPRWGGQLQVIARLSAFPGFGNRTMYIVPGAVVFPHMGRDDPRLRPTGGPPVFVRTELWSSQGRRGIDEVMAPRSIEATLVSTSEQYRQRADYVAARQSRGYDLGVAAYLALLAIVALALHADRTAVAARPGDLMLARVGVGRARIVGARAAELVALVLVALACTVGGLAVLGPMAARLLDPVPEQVPVLRFGVPFAAVAVTAGAAVVAAALATGLAVVRSSAREEEAFRGDG